MTDSTTIPRGIRRDPSSAAAPSPTRPDPLSTRDETAPTLSSPPATARSYVGDWAREQVRQLDEFSLIGYPILTPEQRAVYEVSLRLGAERLLDEVAR